MNIIYNKSTGKIDRAISDDQDYKVFLSNFPQEFVDELESLPYSGTPPRPLSHHYVDIQTKELKKYSHDIIEEKRKYGRTLIEKERVDMLLVPSQQEIKEAQNTLKQIEHSEIQKAQLLIEILPILKEVL